MSAVVVIPSASLPAIDPRSEDHSKLLDLRRKRQKEQRKAEIQKEKAASELGSGSRSCSGSGRSKRQKNCNSTLTEDEQLLLVVLEHSKGIHHIYVCFACCSLHVSFDFTYVFYGYMYLTFLNTEAAAFAEATDVAPATVDNVVLSPAPSVPAVAAGAAVVADAVAVRAFSVAAAVVADADICAPFAAPVVDDSAVETSPLKACPSLPGKG